MGDWNKSQGAQPIDHDIFRFLWRWKLAPTAAVHSALFPNRHPFTTYSRLKALQKRGYLSIYSVDECSRFVWGLTAKAFKSIASSLPEMRKEAFRSEAMDHDYLVSAIHIGPWLQQPEGLQLVSEQELDALQEELLPGWVPDVTGHVPDGYWAVTQNSERTIIALEVERFPKTSSSYETVATFYAERKTILHVVWAVQTKGAANSILSALRRFCPKLGNVHQFLLIEDFKISGWHATFFNGSLKGKSLYESITPTFNPPLSLTALPYLNGSKTGYLPGICTRKPKASKTNRVASQAIPSTQRSNLQNPTNEERSDS